MTRGGPVPEDPPVPACVFSERDRLNAAHAVRKYGVGTKWNRVQGNLYVARTAYGWAALIRGRDAECVNCSDMQDCNRKDCLYWPHTPAWRLVYTDRGGRLVWSDEWWPTVKDAMNMVRSDWSLRPGFEE